MNTTGTSSGSGTSGGGGNTTVKTPQTAKIGSVITLSGNDSGEQMAVTVTKVISSASPGDEITAAPAGDRLYAVQFRLHDTGSAAYSDSPSNGAEVVDSAGQSYQASITDTAAGCTTFPASENIAPGSSGLGCIVFEVPNAAKVTAVQFTLDSGMGPQTGQWSVGLGSPATSRLTQAPGCASAPGASALPALPDTPAGRGAPDRGLPRARLRVRLVQPAARPGMATARLTCVRIGPPE